MACTLVTALSFTASEAGTPAAAVMPGTGTATTSWGPAPESGATGTTSALNSSTRRVPAGATQVRMPVSCTGPVGSAGVCARAPPGARADADMATANARAAIGLAANDRRRCDMLPVPPLAVHGVTGGDSCRLPPESCPLYRPGVLLVQLQSLEPRGLVAVDDHHQRLAGLAHLGHLGLEVRGVLDRHPVHFLDHVTGLDVLVLGLAAVGHVGHAHAR